MKQIIPFKEDLVFKTKIAEICSISLEHEFAIDDDINGDFVISGDYKTHEVSVNRDSFLYRLPFSVTMPDNIVKDSINFEVRDFNYELNDEDTLSVNIEFCIEAQDLKEIKEEEEEIVAIEMPRVEEVDVEDEKDEKQVEEVLPFEVPKEPLNRDLEPQLELIKEEISEEKEETTIDIATQKAIMNSIGEEDTFVSYHVHIVRDMDSLESICTKYSASAEVIKNINGIEEINLGDKIIIPQVANE